MKLSTNRLTALTAAAVLVLSPALYAQTDTAQPANAQTGGSQTSSAQTSSAQTNDASSSMAADKNFVMLADEGNTAEISASQIALKKSKNPDVIAYARQMIADHQKLRSDMAPFATTLGVTTPQPLNPTHKAEAARLSQLSGEKFDKEYIKTMDTDHHKTLGMFNNELATTSNSDLKTVVQQGQPVIAQHTDMADQMAGKMGLPTVATPSE